MIHTRIRIKVKTNAKENAVHEWVEFNGEKVLKISVKELPVSGNANNSVIRLLSKYFKVSQKEVVIISGHKSNIKTVLIYCVL
jgi:uncharacterized protein (TIGR00251 family)